MVLNEPGKVKDVANSFVSPLGYSDSLTDQNTCKMHFSFVFGLLQHWKFGACRRLRSVCASQGLGWMLWYVFVGSCNSREQVVFRDEKV